MSHASFSEIRRPAISAKMESVLLYGVFGLLLFGPLAFGAVEPWSIFAMEAGATALFLAWMGSQVLEGAIKVRWNPLFLPMAAFAGLVLIQLLFHGTAYLHDTASLALLYCAYAILCFLATQVLTRAPQARSLAFAFCIYGTALALFSLIQGISPNGKLYWLRQPRMGGWIYGPYVNHNHYAGLMEMLAPIPLILSLSHLGPPRVRALAGACAALMVGTVFLSGSRGGMLAILFELALLAALLVRQKRSLRTAIGIGVFLALVIGLLAWVGGAELSQRIATVGPGHTGLSADFRMSINRDAVRMFLKRPILGWGLGSFPVVYPQFRSFYTNLFVNQAHNDYLQLLVEMGALGFATMVWFVGTLYGRGARKISGWSADAGAAMALACLLGVTGILVHSAVDFNLQIPANAALFYVMATVAGSEPFAKPAHKRRRARKQPAEEIIRTSENLQPSGANF
jgi:O-antigen ligase